jgi:hypothetical protein
VRQTRTSAEHHLEQVIRSGSVLVGGRGGAGWEARSLLCGGGGQVGTQQLSLRACLYPHPTGREEHARSKRAPPETLGVLWGPDEPPHHRHGPCEER